jgi:hypothetical protein
VSKEAINTWTVDAMRLHLTELKVGQRDGSVATHAITTGVGAAADASRALALLDGLGLRVGEVSRLEIGRS